MKFARVGMAAVSVLAVTALGVANADAGSPQGQTAVVQSSFTLTGSDAVNARLVSDTVNADGSETGTWALASGDTFQISGDPGATITMGVTTRTGSDVDGGDLTLGVSPLAVDKSDPQAVIDAYQKPGRSVVNDAIAVGIAADEAQNTFGQLMVDDPEGGPVTPSSRIIGSWCTSRTAPGGASVGWAKIASCRTV